MKKTAMIVGFVLALGLFFLSSAHAQIKINDTLCLNNLVIPNSCTDGDLYLEGCFHIVARGDIKNDRLHLMIHVNGQNVRAEDNSADYVGNGSLNLTINVDMGDGEPAVLTAVLNINLIGQGTTENYASKVRLHFTVNANGELTAEIISIELPGCDVI